MMNPQQMIYAARVAGYRFRYLRLSVVCRYGVLGIVFDTREGKDVRFESVGYRFRYL